MRNRFEQQLAILNRELISAGAMCENAIAMAAKALVDGSLELAADVPDISVQIDRKEREIENLCMKLLVQQQPVAGDLRVISSALKMVTDMERIGHQAADIAEIVTMANIRISDDKLCIDEMARATIKMVTESIDAFVKKDTAIAQAVIEYDDVVDDYFNRVKKELTGVFCRSDADAESALDLLMIAKYFERIGDHAVNIAEWVVFSITGRHKEGEL